MRAEQLISKVTKQLRAADFYIWLIPVRALPQATPCCGSLHSPARGEHDTNWGGSFPHPGCLPQTNSPEVSTSLLPQSPSVCRAFPKTPVRNRNFGFQDRQNLFKVLHPGCTNH